jgi:regulator of sigma E protease
VLLTTLLAFLFVLGVLIFVHELGHFLAARRHGVRVLTFSLGFGPKILKVKRGDTEYCISAVPLGGYVKMAGENPEDPRSGQPDEFLSKTKWQRFQILFAGPAMNILLAVAVTAFVLAIQGVRVPVYFDEPAVIGSVVASSPAERAGLRRGDRVITISGDTIETWKDLELAIGLRRPNRDLSMTVLRDGQPVTTSVRPVAEGRYEVSDIGVMPNANPVILRVLPGQRAEQAGLKAGDIILAVNGERMATRAQLIEVISNSGDKSLQVTVRRGEGEETVAATPEQQGPRGWLGVELTEPYKSFTPGPFEAVKLSVEHNIESSGIIFRTLGGLFTGETSVKQLQGPVGIAQLSGESAQEGFITLLSLMAMLSINLGILNLMPVPVLDGGHILIMALEGIARRDFSMQVKEKMLLAGFVVLMMLMVTVIYNDLTRITWIERLMPWRN